MKAADKLVGKGLDTWIIIQLISYNLSWMVVLVVPMSVLVATLMAFGSMSQNNEITIMKSSGVSLYKMMFGPAIASIMIAFLLVEFNNEVLPDANHQAKILMIEISQKKPTLSLEPGVFSQEVSNYAILVREVDKNSNKIKGVTIYDYTNPMRVAVVTASNGNIYFSNDQRKLIMDLEHGEIHESNVGETTMYRKLIFNNHRIALDASQFSLSQGIAGVSRSERELSANAMRSIVDSLMQIKISYQSLLDFEVSKFFVGDSTAISTYSKSKKDFSKSSDYFSVAERVRAAKNMIQSSYLRLDYIQREINKYDVEIYKKYSIPAACIVFILLGAPLGVMTRKGGFGMAASISLFFFLIYWAALIGGEKLADRAIISPFWGMWSANVIMGIVGIYVTVRAAKETINLEFSFLKKLIPKKFRQEEVVDENP